MALQIKRHRWSGYWLQARKHIWVVFPSLTSVLAWASFELDKQQVFQTFAPTVYSHWDKNLLNSVLGILAQIMGFLITFITTAMFVVRQYLSDRLPELVVRRITYENTLIAPVFTLFLVLAYDLILLFLTPIGFVPLLGTGLILTVCLLSTVFCIYSVFISNRAFDVSSIIYNIGSRSIKAIESIDLHTLNTSLSEITELMKFFSTNGFREFTAQSMSVFFGVAKAWSENVEATFRTITNKDQQVVGVRDTLSEKYRIVLREAIQRSDTTMFFDSLRKLISTYPNVSTNLALKYQKDLLTLCTSEQTLIDPELSGALAVTGLLAVVNGIEQANTSLVETGAAMLRKLWGPYTSSEVLKSRLVGLSVLALAGMNTALRKNLDSSFADIVRAQRDGLLRTYVGWGQLIVEDSLERLYNRWISGLESILTDLGKAQEFTVIAHVTPGIRKVYARALAMRCEEIRQALPSAISRVLEKSCVDRRTVQEAMNLANEFEPPGPDDDETSSLVSIFIAVYNSALKYNDQNTALTALDVISRFPVYDSVLNSAVLRFYLRNTSLANDNSKTVVARHFFESLLKTLMRELKRQNVQGSRYLLSAVRAFLEGSVMSAKEHAMFIEFCGELPDECDLTLRQNIYLLLNAFLTKNRSPELLAKAVRMYHTVALVAAEEQNETLVRLCSNYVGQLTYILLSQDVSLDTKINLLRQVLQWHRALFETTRKFALSRATQVFLATLYIVLAAGCEERPNAVERETLLTEIAEVVRSIDDPQLIEDAFFARTYHFPSSVVPENEPYWSMWTKISPSHLQVAASNDWGGAVDRPKSK